MNYTYTMYIAENLWQCLTEPYQRRHVSIKSVKSYFISDLKAKNWSLFWKKKWNTLLPITFIFHFWRTNVYEEISFSGLVLCPRSSIKMMKNKLDATNLSSSFVIYVLECHLNRNSVRGMSMEHTCMSRIGASQYDVISTSLCNQNDTKYLF